MSKPGVRWMWLIGLLYIPVETAAQSPTFDIYWVDVEGGAATLVVSPTGESLLIDTGYPGADNRDASRILAATQEAGLTRIDYLVITHFHRDHVGGLQALAGMIPIEKCFDHGTTTEESNQQWLDAYLSVCGDKRAAVEAGEKIPFGSVEIDVIASDGRLVTTPVNNGGSNTLCVTAEHKPQASPENQRSVGALFTYGRFTFLDLGDLNWAKEVELSCPVNKVGEVTLYQTSRHGAWDDGGLADAPLCDQASGRRREQRSAEGAGGTSPGFREVSTAHYDRIAESPGIEGIWQGHRSLLDPDPAHNTAEDMIANLEETAECTAIGFGRRSARTARSPSRTAATGSAEPTRRAEPGACARGALAWLDGEPIGQRDSGRSAR